MAGSKPSPEAGWRRPRSAGAPDLPRERALDRHGDGCDQWIGIHSNGIHTYPMECTRDGLDWYPMQWIPMHTIGYQSTTGRRPGENAKERRGFSLQSG